MTITNYDFLSESYPRWLIDIAIRVDSQIKDDKVLAHFRRMLDDWSRWHHAKDKPPLKRTDPEHGEVIEVQHNPVELLPSRRAMELVECYATLSAIHDAVCDSPNIQVDPWEIPYYVLRSFVADLSGDDKERIEQLTTEVEADLERLKVGEAVRTGSASDPLETLRSILDSAAMSARDIATQLNLSYNKVRKRLGKHKTTDSDCFIESENRRRNEPRFFYCVGKIRPVLEDLIRAHKSPKNPTNVPTEKK